MIKTAILIRSESHGHSHLFDLIYRFLLLAFAFLMPFGSKPVALLIGLLAVSWLLKGNLKQGFKNMAHPIVMCLFISYYVYYFIGLSYSVNMHFGWKDMETKLSMLIFPLILMSTPLEQIWLRRTLLAFIAGCTLTLLVCFSYGLYRYTATGQIEFLTYNLFSLFLHPGYFSMYVCLAVCLVFFLIRDSAKNDRKLKILLSILLPFLLISLVFLASKTGIVVAILFFFGLVFYAFRHKKLLGFGLLIIVSCMALFGIVKIPFLANRFEPMKESLLKPVESGNREGTAVRIMIWKAALELIKEAPLFGVGTGDIKDEMMKKYAQKNMQSALFFELNVHNQFLQTAVALGLSGLVIMLASMLIPLSLSIQEGNYFYVAFIGIVIVNFLTESALETQAGVVFFAFFNSFLYTKTGFKKSVLV
jgi:O-antigen ligase